jgi:hypothetical protein
LTLDDRVQWRLDRHMYLEAYELAKANARFLEEKTALVSPATTKPQQAGARTAAGRHRA